MTDPKLQIVGVYDTARTYHLRSTERLGGWALCTVNDRTGELLIVSDWGNWSHSWYTPHLGRPSLTHFIADRFRGRAGDCDYLACKLLGRAGSRVLDADATIAAWRNRLCEARLECGRRGSRSLTAFRAREIWDALGSLEQDAAHEQLFLEHAYQIDGFTEWVSEEPWESCAHRPSNEYRVLVDYILPALVQACATTLDERVAATYATEAITAS